MLLNPIIAMLHNEKTDRWHPIVFVEAPLPGPNPPVTRHRSKMHHTTGFETRAEAEANARDDLGPKIRARTPYARQSFRVVWTGHPDNARILWLKRSLN
jgi:hypothetical protein